MQAMILLHNFLQNELSSIHKTRLQCLMDACCASVSCNRLWLTGLGREMVNQSTTRSNIQKVNRLLGNTHLQSERSLFYELFGKYLLPVNRCPRILVDWTVNNAETNKYILRASISVKGRSVTLYEESHPKKHEGNHSVHKNFLNQLKGLLSEDMKPVIVTDAGFRTPWFEHVKHLGWDFVGRVRNKHYFQEEGSTEWTLCSILHETASTKVRVYPNVSLTKANKLKCHLVLYKAKSKNRVKKNCYKKKSESGSSKLHAKRQKEPWVLVTSLDYAQLQPKKVVVIYRQRMRIEENIRDTKCPYYGLGLKKSLTRSTERMNILLLIAALVTFAAWLAGLICHARGEAKNYQAHSSSSKNVLSIVFLGRYVIRRNNTFTMSDFYQAITELVTLINNTLTETF